MNPLVSGGSGGGSGGGGSGGGSCNIKDRLYTG